MTQLLLFNLFNGLIIGAFYALMALGLSLILNLSGVINFAHGGFLAIGGYLAYMLIPHIGFWGALAVAPVLTARKTRVGGSSWTWESPGFSPRPARLILDRCSIRSQTLAPRTCSPRCPRTSARWPRPSTRPLRRPR